MKTTHKFIFGDSRKKILKNESVDLVVTSPPYPMIEMWDDIFKSMNPKINIENPTEAFKLMNLELKKVYKKVYDALKDGGIFVINIGDAVRSLNGLFRLYHNGARTIEMCTELGFDLLPQIYWWKPTNSPNKFMGSGMYPVSAYVTLETEHILIFRKGKRDFNDINDKIKRQESAFFQNERNLWFSNIWKDVTGVSQKITGLGRERNAAFPIELPLRIINMFSIKGDVVWDPFGGTGTTTIASIVSCRNSIINDIDMSFINFSKNRILNFNVQDMNKIIENRIAKNSEYTSKKSQNLNVSKPKYVNRFYGAVQTKQELKIKFNKVLKVEERNEFVEVKYEI